MEKNLIKLFLRQLEINLENAHNIINKIDIDQITEYEKTTFQIFRNQTVSNIISTYGYIHNLINKIDTI